MIRLISRVRISQKLWGTPVVLMLFMVAQGSVARYGAIQQGAALRNIVDIAFAKDRDLAAAGNALATVQIGLYRLVSLQANSKDAGKEVAVAQQQMQQGEESVTSLLDTIATRFVLSSDERKAVDTIRAAQKAYVSAVKDAVDIAGADVAPARLPPVLSPSDPASRSPSQNGGKLAIPGDLQQLIRPRSPSSGLPRNALAPVL
jgi:hypothetical protein